MEIDRDKVIREILSQIKKEEFYAQSLQSIKRFILDEDILRKEMLKEFENKLRDFIDIWEFTWKLHNSLSLEEISLISLVKCYRNIFYIPEFLKLLENVLDLHNRLDVLIYLLAPLSKLIVENVVERLKREFNLSQEEIYVLLTPLEDSFYTLRFRKLSEALCYGKEDKTFVKSLVNELYGGSFFLFEEDLKNFIKHQEKIDCQEALNHGYDIEERKKILKIRKNHLSRKIGDVVWEIERALIFDNTYEYIYFRSALYGIEDFYLRKLLSQIFGVEFLEVEENIHNLYINNMKRLKYKIPKYRQNYVCFSACFVNLLSYFLGQFNKSLKDWEWEITEKASAWPYLFILMPKLGEISIDFGLSATLIQTRENIPDFEEAKKEYERWGMKFYRVKEISKNAVKLGYLEEEEITRENYEYIKNAYITSLLRATQKGLKIKVVRDVTPDLLLEDLRKGNLSIWVIMLGKYGHANLLYGYDEGNKIFYFFDPLYGGRVIRFSDVGKYLESPIMKLGLSIGIRWEEKTSTLNEFLSQGYNFLTTISNNYKIFKFLEKI